MGGRSTSGAVLLPTVVPPEPAVTLHGEVQGPAESQGISWPWLKAEPNVRFQICGLLPRSPMRYSNVPVRGSLKDSGVSPPTDSGQGWSPGCAGSESHGSPYVCPSGILPVVKVKGAMSPVEGHVIWPKYGVRASSDREKWRTPAYAPAVANCAVRWPSTTERDSPAVTVLGRLRSELELAKAPGSTSRAGGVKLALWLS